MRIFNALAIGAFVALASSASLSIAEPPDAERLLTRTIYVPVHFSVEKELLDHLRIWIEDRDGEDMQLSTMPHTFMFTYFPGNERVLRPERIEVRLRAESGCLGPALDTNFFVTPFGIFTSEDAIAFDLEKLTKQLSARRRDLRVPKKVVRVVCPDGEKAESSPDEIEGE